MRVTLSPIEVFKLQSVGFLALVTVSTPSHNHRATVAQPSHNNIQRALSIGREETDKPRMGLVLRLSE